MAEFRMPEFRVGLNQLRPGVFIRLERKNWFNHPFLFNSFKIKDDNQIRILAELGIDEVICVPEKCECLPGRPQHIVEVPSTVPPSPDPSPELEQLWRVKRERAEKLRVKREAIAKCERKYAVAVKEIDEYVRGALAGDNDLAMEALRFVHSLAKHFLEDSESTLHLMNILPPEEQTYSHLLNVTILSLMLAREADIDSNAMIGMGAGAIFHDLGKERIDRKVVKKRGLLTKPEMELLRRHPQMASDMLSKLPAIPSLTCEVVQQHHEFLDGSGYPLGLMNGGICQEARIISVVNTYDRLINHPDVSKSLTPYLALSFMFTQLKDKLDESLLSLFIRCLGVYPPGTIVQLSNGNVGMVMTVNPDNQLNPNLVMYDPEIPRREALIVDLADEPELKVEKSIRISHLPKEIMDYLNPRTRISYCVDDPN